MSYSQAVIHSTLLRFLGLALTILTIGFCTSAAQAASTFEEPVNYIIGGTQDIGYGSQISDTAVADLNGDGFLDIAGTIPEPFWDVNGEANPDEGVVILLNNADGAFSIASYITQQEHPVGIAASDFDGDGDVDLVTVNSASNNLAILLNDGSGVFTVTSQYATGFTPEQIGVADMDSDGDADLLTTAYDLTQSGSQQGDPAVQIFLNDGGAVFTANTIIRTSSPISDFVVVDVDVDGDLDVVTGSGGTGVADLTVAKNNGTGSSFIVTETTVLVPDLENGPEFDDVKSGDIDNDGDIDIIASMNGTVLDTLVILKNNGSGIFTLDQTFDYTIYPESVVVSDFDNDSNLDIITTNGGAEEIHFLKNDGFGTYTLVEKLPNVTFAGETTSLSSSDMNNDGNNDLVISSIGHLGIWVILQADTGEQTPVEQAAALVIDVLDLDVPNNLENSYLANLFKVEGFVESGQITPAINQLTTFISKVNQDYSQNKLTIQERDNLVAAAQQLIDDLLPN